MLRDLCRPVAVREGGQTWEEVARRVGRGFNGLHVARLSGRLEARYVRGLRGRRGNPVPILSAEEELDPNGRAFAPPDEVWGWTARCLARGLDEKFQASLARVPIFRSVLSARQFDEHEHPEVHESRRGKDRTPLPAPPPDYVWYKWSARGEFLGDDPRHWRKSPADPGVVVWVSKEKRRRKRRCAKGSGSLQFLGWMWRCPKCAKLVRILYLPTKQKVLLKRQGDKEKGGQERDEKNSDRSAPLVSVSPCPPVSFACYACHRVRTFSRIDSKNSWNELVSYLSGGLLYGREVERPSWFDTRAKRKQAFRPRPTRAAPRRQQVLRRMLNGWTILQIARDLKMSKQQASDSIRILCRQEGAKNRRELARKLGSPHFQPMDSDRACGRKLNAVAECPKEGGVPRVH